MTRARGARSRKRRPKAGAGGSGDGPYDTFGYWLMPHGLKAFLTTVFWSDGAAARRRRKAPPPDPRRRMPFPLLAPGKTAAQGEHAFWRGRLWGKTVALQGDS